MPSERTPDKRLYTPGPLTTSRTVKSALARDLGSRDFEFIAAVRDIRQKLAELGGSHEGRYTAVIMQGSGTFGVEAVIGSTIPPDGKLLVVINGAYGRRIAHIAETLKIETVRLTFPEDQTPDIGQIEAALAADPAITMLAIVHCETTTGIINPIFPVGMLAQHYGKAYFVDAMSSFGAVPVDLAVCGITYLVSSSNKCIEGVPGFSFTLADRAALLACAGYARSVSLDLVAQYQGLEKDGQFRFTPPVQALLAFQQALVDLEAEGGVEGRAARYRANYETLIEGMARLGFREYLPREKQGYIITAFHYPIHPHFRFDDFYSRLNAKGFVIYPGKLSDADCFRIGSIGRLYPADMEALLAAIRETLAEMNITVEA